MIIFSVIKKKKNLYGEWELADGNIPDNTE